MSVSRFGLPLLCAALPSLAYAQDVSSLPDVPLAVTGCGDEFEQELRASLRIEIDALTQERPDRSRPDLLLIRIDCAGPDLRRLEVISRDGRHVTTELDQTELAPDARIRALALSATEAVDALWAKKTAEPRRPSTSLRAEPRRPRATVGPRRRFSLMGGPSVERAGRPGVWLLGGSLSLEWRWGSALVSLVEARAQTGTADTELGSVDVQTWTGAIHGLMGASVGRWHWGVGPGARLGVAVLEGEPNRQLQGDRFQSAWGGPTLKARIVHQPEGSQWLVALAGDAGLVACGLVGTLDDARRIFALDGAWIGITLGVGVSG